MLGTLPRKYTAADGLPEIRWRPIAGRTSAAVRHNSECGTQYIHDAHRRNIAVGIVRSGTTVAHTGAESSPKCLVWD